MSYGDGDLSAYVNLNAAKRKSLEHINSTRVLSPRYAVGWAAFFNFIAFAVFGLHVAATIGTGIVAPSVIDRATRSRKALIWDCRSRVAGRGSPDSADDAASSIPLSSRRMRSIGSRSTSRSCARARARSRR